MSKYRGTPYNSNQQYWINRYAQIGIETTPDPDSRNIARQLIMLEQGISSIKEYLEIHYKFGIDREEHATNEIQRIIDEVITPLGLDHIRLGRNILILDKDGIIGFLIKGFDSPTTINFSIYANKNFIDDFKKLFNERFDQTVPPAINRITLDRKNDNLYAAMELVSLRPENDRLMEMYPYLDQTPAEIWEGFKNSDSNVLLFIGPPGTGKSNFFNEILRYRGYTTGHTYLADQDNVLLHPGLTDFIRGLPEDSVVITEDSDKMVAKREDGNSNMAGMLNTTAGLVSTKTKLMISTNLSSTSKVDEALLRPGRAYKVIKFELLTPAQANRAREVNGLPPVEFTQDKLTLAEALNAELDDTNRNAPKLGF